MEERRRLYTMKQACELTGMNYEALKFYCNAGLVPNLKRDANNRRVFSDRDIAWINGLGCLRRCGLGIADMRHYAELCRVGVASIPERRTILDAKRAELEAKLAEINASIAYIDAKQRYYDDVEAGRVPYQSNLDDD